MEELLLMLVALNKFKKIIVNIKAKWKYKWGFCLYKMSHLFSYCLALYSFAFLALTEESVTGDPA